MSIRLKTRWIGLCAIGWFVTGCQSTSLPPLSAKIHGMTEAGYQPDVFNSPVMTQSLKEMRRDGINWLSIQVAWFQRTNQSVNLFPSPQKTPTDASVSHLIRLAHQMGFRVFLDPFVNSLQGNGWQANFDPRSVPAWFRSFDHYLHHYAVLAQQDHVDLFAIGDEMDSLDAVPAYRPYWLQAIHTVRQAYRGPITYGADFVHYQSVTFWPALDQVGLDAYFPLSQAPNPSLASLKTAWNHIADQIQTWRVTDHLENKPFVITELGYCSETGAAANPGAWYPNLPVDLGIQVKLYQATLATIARRPWNRGIFWFWWANPSNPDWQGGPRDNGYTPRGKPAEGVLRRAFTGH
ncbi:MAG: hypothetical protein OWQ57_07805 [Sulfobacillus sp.]|nr:hypothetical protein [Sulfobacillus sp.]